MREREGELYQGESASWLGGIDAPIALTSLCEHMRTIMMINSLNSTLWTAVYPRAVFLDPKNSPHIRKIW